MVLPWNERYEEQHVEKLGERLRAAATAGSRP